MLDAGEVYTVLDHELSFPLLSVIEPAIKAAEPARRAVWRAVGGAGITFIPPRVDQRVRIVTGDPVGADTVVRTVKKTYPTVAVAICGVQSEAAPRGYVEFHLVR